METSLGLTLAFLALPVAQASVDANDLPPAQQTYAVRAAALSETPLSRGTVLLRKTEEAVPPPSQAELDARLEHMAANAAQSAAQAVQAQTLETLNASRTALEAQMTGLSQQTRKVLDQTKETLASTESRLTTMAQSSAAQTAAVLQASTEAQKTAFSALNGQNQTLQSQLAGLQSQTSEALKQLADRQVKTEADTREYARLQALNAQISAQKEALQVAQQQAIVAEARQRYGEASVKDYAKAQAQLAQAEAQREALQADRLQAALSTARQRDADAVTRDYAKLQAQLAQVTAQKEALRMAVQQANAAESRAKETSERQVAGLQSRMETSLASQKELTESRMASLEKQAEANRRLADVQMALVATQLKGYADRQMAQMTASTSETLARVAAASHQDVSRLRDETADRLKTVWQAAQHRANTLAEEKAGLVAKQLAMYQSKAEAERLTPQQVAAIASQTIVGAQPEFRALALQAMKENQDYIKTVATDMLGSKDPRVAGALADTVKDIIVKDNRIVFAMRKAVAEGLTPPASAVTRLGNGWNDPSVRKPDDTAAAHADREGQTLQLASQLVALQAETMRAIQSLKDKPQPEDKAEKARTEAILARLEAQQSALESLQKQMAAQATLQPSAMVAAMPALQAGANVSVEDPKKPEVKQGPATLAALPAPGVSESIAVDAERLKIAALQPPAGDPSATATVADAFLAALSPAAGEAPSTTLPQAMATTAMPSPAWQKGKDDISVRRANLRTDLGDLRKYRVVIHEDNKPLDLLLGDILKRAEPFVGPWQIKWKISEANKDILDERFSLDAETTFDDFVAYVAQYMGNERGVKLSFSLFDAERIIVVSD